MSIFKDISHLLYYNDCVILPNFGAFVLKSKSAYIEDNEFFPPSKYVSFNSMLKDNDGLLAKFISEERKISYKKSLKLISDEVKLLNEKLSEDLIFDTEYLGIFELKEKNTLIFNPDFSINFDSSVFGLNSFVRKPIINISSKRAADKSQFDTNNLLRYAAIFISILGLSYFGYFNYNNRFHNDVSFN